MASQGNRGRGFPCFLNPTGGTGSGVCLQSPLAGIAVHEGPEAWEELNVTSRFRPAPRARPLGAVAQRGLSGGVAADTPRAADPLNVKKAVLLPPGVAAPKAGWVCPPGGIP